MLENALGFLRGGLSTIPIAANGSKAPAISSWEKFKSKRRPTEAEIRQWFPAGKILGAAILMGGISGNLVVFDFERKTTYFEWAKIIESEVESGVLDECPIVETPRGMHVYVRTPQVEKGRKLANELVVEESKDGKEKTKRNVLIEIRGDGQYCVAPGSPPECHPKHIGWVHKWGPPVWEAPKITQKDWEIFLSIARQFEEAPDPAKRVTGIKSVFPDDRRPGSDYCRKATFGTWRELLCRYKWTMLKEDSNGRQIWKRPGKAEKGGSATLGFCKTNLGDEFYVFSTSADPFKAEHCYSIFAARTLLEFGGDFKKIVPRLVLEGFGAVAPEDVKREVEVYINKAKAAEKMDASVNKIHEKIESWKANRKFKTLWEGRSNDFGEPGLYPERYDTALLLFAYKRLQGPEKSGLIHGIQLVRLWRKKYDEDPNLAFNVEYMAKKIAWIQSKAGKKNEIEILIEEELKKTGETTESKTEYLCKKIGFPFIRLEQTVGGYDVVIVYLVLSAELRIKIGKWDVLKDWRKLEVRIQAFRSQNGDGVPGFDGVIPVAIKDRISWTSTERTFHKIMKTIDSGPSEEEELIEAAEQYADNCGAFATENKTGEAVRQALIDQKPFVQDSYLFLRPDGFGADWLKKHTMFNPTKRELAVLLREAGFCPVLKQYSTKTARISRRCWMIEENKLPRMAIGEQI